MLATKLRLKEIFLPKVCRPNFKVKVVVNVPTPLLLFRACWILFTLPFSFPFWIILRLCSYSTDAKFSDKERQRDMKKNSILIERYCARSIQVKACSVPVRGHLLLPAAQLVISPPVCTVSVDELRVREQLAASVTLIVCLSQVIRTPLTTRPKRGRNR